MSLYPRLVRTGVVIIVLGISLTACGPRVPSVPSRREVAQANLEAGKWWLAYSGLADDLRSSNPAIKESALALVKQYPQFVPGVLAELRADIQRVASPSGAMGVKRRIEAVGKTGICEPAQIDALWAELTQMVREGYRLGRLTFLLDDPISEFLPSDPAVMASIFERSLRALEDKTNRPSMGLVAHTFAYVKTQGAGSRAFQQLEQALPNIAFSKEQLETVVKQVYPAFAEQALRDIVILIYLKTEPSRRLLEEDVTPLLRRRSELFTVVRDPQPGAMTVLLRELQFEERQDPERTQTVVIGNLQIDFLVAALTLPRGASMLFEYTEGHAEIAWAYEVIASQDGQTIHEKLLRDTTRQDYHFCANMRVQNVFGGMQAAYTYPNAQVKQLCESGQRPVRVSDLRAEVTKRLVDEIAAIPVLATAIARAH